MSEKEKTLGDFFDLKNSDQISGRLYYLYYRVIATLREEQESSFNNSYYTITAIIGGFMGILSLFVFIKDVDDVYKSGIIITSVVVISVLCLYKKFKSKPKPVYDNFEDDVTLAIDLDQIFKQSSECIILMQLLDKNKTDDDLNGFLLDTQIILKKFIEYTEDHKTKLKKEDLYESALETNHIDSDYVERRITFGKSVLRRTEQYQKL